MSELVSRFTIASPSDRIVDSVAVRMCGGRRELMAQRSDGWHLIQLAAPTQSVDEFAEALAREVGVVVVAQVDERESVRIVLVGEDATVSVIRANAGELLSTDGPELVAAWAERVGRGADMEPLRRALTAEEPFGEYVVAAVLDAVGVWPKPGAGVWVRWRFTIAAE